MLYGIAALLGLFFGLIAGGSISNLVSIKLKKIWLILLICIIQIAVRFLSANGLVLFKSQGAAAQILLYLVLLGWFWINRHYFGFLIMGFGCASNFIAIAANNGKMPVSKKLADLFILNSGNINKLSQDGKHIITDSGINLGFLTDIIHLPPILRWGMDIVSIGDLIVAAGLLIAVFELIRNKSIGNIRKFSTLSE
ncbi:MAG: DUF5317 domain-containing protein [Bacillota bacterium]|nr:DUF5317 domain-containing protein [Bacillota bacterium]